MTVATAAHTAHRWTCTRCGVAVGRLDGLPVPLPETWETCSEGEFCLSCRRGRAADAALEEASNSSMADRARARRTGLIEFEVRRTPGLADGAIAKACRTSTATVAAARKRLCLDSGPVPGSDRN